MEADPPAARVVPEAALLDSVAADELASLVLIDAGLQLLDLREAANHVGDINLVFFM